MKFKQYKLIIESDKKEDKDPHPMFKDMTNYRKKIDSEDEIVKLIKDKCDVKNYLYRGFEDDGDYYIIDGSKGKRVSRNTTNYYTVIIDEIFKTSVSYKGYPLRSESIICSTSKKTAEHYGNLYVVLPFKGVEIGYIGSDDIWNKEIEIGDFNLKIDQWNIIFEYMNISDDNFHDIINTLVRDHRDGIMELKQYVEDLYHDLHSEDDDYDEYYEANADAIEEVINDSEAYLGFELTNDANDLVNVMKESNLSKYIILVKMFGCEELSRDELEKKIRNLYDPYELGFELIKTDRLNQHTDHEDVECWFGDKCVAVSFDKWDEIKKKV